MGFQKSLWENIRERLYILNYLGSLLWLLGLLLLLPLIPWYLYGEQARFGLSPWTFLAPALACMALGFIVQREFSYKTPSIRGAMIITALGWTAAGLAGGLPYMLGLQKGFIDAFFESVSGFTTTGITLFQGLDSMPRSILFWRSLTQWLGGLGILSFFMAVSFRGGGAAAALFLAEGHKIEAPRPAPGIFHTLAILWGIYCSLTILAGFCFWLAGMSGFDALNHCLTCISTGGFSTHDASAAYWQALGSERAWLIELVVTLFMLAGGTSFLIHYSIISGRARAVLKDFEFRLFSATFAAAVLLMAADHMAAAARGQEPFFSALGSSFRTAAFQAASLITSTGYLTADINGPFFPSMSRLVIFLLMIAGGCVGSTAGGVKILRVGILLKLAALEIRRFILPRRAVTPVTLSGRVVPEPEIRRIAALVFIWLVLVAAGGMITAVCSDLGPLQALSGMASALGNMGPFFFSVSQMAEMGPVVKLTYIAGMLAGRLEIMPLAVLVAIIFRRI